MSLKFEPLTAEKLYELKPMFQLRPTLCCESHFAYHLIWNYYYETRYHADEKGIVWLQKIDRDKMATLVPICRPEHMRENFVRLQKYFTETLRVKMHMYLVDQEALDAICPDEERYEIIPDENSYDYIYDGESLRTLPGNAYRKKRNMANGFERDYGDQSEFVWLTQADEEEIRSFMERWFEGREDTDPLNRLSSEEKGILEAIRWGQKADVTIAGIRVNHVLEAVTIGSYEAQKDMAVIHVEKANAGLRGLYAYIGMKFLQKAYPAARYVNREDDMGLENLRKAKESLHPVLRGIKYTIREK